MHQINAVRTTETTKVVDCTRHLPQTLHTVSLSMRQKPTTSYLNVGAHLWPSEDSFPFPQPKHMSALLWLHRDLLCSPSNI